jgi:hypothetical protein
MHHTRRLDFRWAAALGLINVLFPCQADITLDGSMGPAGALADPHFQIGAELGRQVGGSHCLHDLS